MREIPSAPGYSADENGDIWKDGRKLKVCAYGRDGYVGLTLSVDGWRRKAHAHRLVCEAYNGPCPEGQQCRHVNGVRNDNRPSNLAWGTHADQIADRKRHGTLVPRRTYQYVQTNLKLTRSDRDRLVRIAETQNLSLTEVLICALKHYEISVVDKMSTTQRQSVNSPAKSPRCGRKFASSSA